MLQELNKIHQSRQPYPSKSQHLQTKKSGKIIDRIEAASKTEKKKIIKEWVLEEIKKINEAEECDF